MLSDHVYRLRLLHHWLGGRRNGVGFFDLLTVALDPTLGRKARRYIERIDEEPPYWYVQLRGIPRPLYFPIAVGKFMLEMLVVEQFHTRDWHFYQIEPTRLRSDDIVLDCGAAEGMFSLQAEHLCKRVYAAEPVSMWIEAMTKTFAGSSKFEILPYALSDANGELRLSMGILDSTIADTDDGIMVQSRTVDSLFAERGLPLTYIKADIEGAELRMLTGAERTIAANQPRIAITTYHEAGHAAEISAFLRRVVPKYRILTKGIEYRAGAPVMLHAWIE
ncbi:MAG: FkbM family methyltransferase [Planctomycetota bacterium]